ncbi:MAG: TatD family deoxyribonuclease [Methanobacteriota archaeon]|nr:MAG: TatD family deoxyribonuclease [Euryarchaeota archaeon]
MIVDIHCHIPRSPFLHEIEKWIEKWKALDVVAVGCMAMNLHQSKINLELVSRHPILLAGVGIHPWKVKRKFSDKEFEELYVLVKKSDIVGEIGLDYRFVKDQHRFPLQREFMARVLRLISESKKPASIHCVGAERDMYDLIVSSEVDPTLLSFHWYSGSIEYLSKFSEMGCYFSLNPAIAKSSGHQQVLEQVPPKQWLTESDGNVKYDGILGEPTLISSIVLPYISEKTQMELDELKKLVYENFKHFLRR